MEQFQTLLPSTGKQVTYLEDLGSLRVSDLQKIFSVYKQKLSGVKADLVLVMHHFVIMPHFVIPAPLCNKTCPTL